MTTKANMAQSFRTASADRFMHGKGVLFDFRSSESIGHGRGSEAAPGSGQMNRVGPVFIHAVSGSRRTQVR